MHVQYCAPDLSVFILWPRSTCLSDCAEQDDVTDAMYKDSSSVRVTSSNEKSRDRGQSSLSHHASIAGLELCFSPPGIYSSDPHPDIFVSRRSSSQSIPPHVTRAASPAAQARDDAPGGCPLATEEERLCQLYCAGRCIQCCVVSYFSGLRVVSLLSFCVATKWSEIPNGG